ncbi:malignant fibrous histiocytoma-amplified sequence 1 homolog [Branchiostoma floridae x Branchiostoma belcheri]
MGLILSYIWKTDGEEQDAEEEEEEDGPWSLQELKQKCHQTSEGLMELNLQNCGLTSIPSAVFRLEEVQILNISWNKLTHVSAGIGALRQLQVLHVEHNQLSSLPAELADCPNLAELHAGWNSLSCLPARYRRMANLKLLSLYSNDFKSLPDSVPLMPSLEYADFEHNSLKGLPMSMSKSKVKVLKLSMNQFQHVPLVLVSMPSLEKLDMSSNKISSLPDIIGSMPQVRSLNFARNCIQVLPQTVCELSSIEELNFLQNKIAKLPPGISHLTRLRSVNFEGNALSTFPSEVCAISSLEEVNFNNNHIEFLPVHISNLKRVRALRLSNNRIPSLPNSICELTELETLTLMGNKLTELPLMFDSLRNLQHRSIDSGLDLFNNEMQMPPRHVCDSGVESVFQYLREIRRTKPVEVNRRKILVFGESGAGKTSMIHAMLNGRSRLALPDEQTHVLEQHTWTVEGERFQVNDFGGQQMYHVTNQLFFTRNAVNVLVFDMNRYGAARYNWDVGDWVQAVTAQVPDAVLLLVGTHSDLCTAAEIQRKREEILATMRQRENAVIEDIKEEIFKLKEALGGERNGLFAGHNRFAGMSTEELTECHTLLQRRLTSRPVLPDEMVVVSSADSLDGIPLLVHTVLQCTQNPQLFPKTVVPESWADLERQLTESRSGPEHFLTYEQVVRMAGDFGLTEDRLIPALRYLHLVGEILWYEDNAMLKEYVFHKPSDLIDIFKAIFRHDIEDFLTYGNDVFKRVGHMTKQQFRLVKSRFLKGGQMSVGLLRCFLWGVCADHQSLSVVVSLLKKFELCYQLPESEATPGLTGPSTLLFLPWYLSYKEPSNLHKMWPTAVPANYCQLQVMYQFPSVSPCGLFERMLVRLQRHVVRREDWKDGVVASIRNQTVLLRRTAGDEDCCELNLYVRGEELTAVWTVLLLLHTEMTSLLSLWPGVRHQVFLLCSHCTCRGLPDPHCFFGEVLERPRPAGVSRLPCPNADDEEVVDVALVYPPPEALEGVLQEGDLRTALMEVAQQLGRDDWRSTGRVLGLAEADLEEIQHDFQTLREMKFQMLLSWQRKAGEDATLHTLMAALGDQEVRRKDIADSLAAKYIQL